MPVFFCEENLPKSCKYTWKESRQKKMCFSDEIVYDLNCQRIDIGQRILSQIFLKLFAQRCWISVNACFLCSLSQLHDLCDIGSCSRKIVTVHKRRIFSIQKYQKKTKIINKQFPKAVKDRNYLKFGVQKLSICCQWFRKELVRKRALHYVFVTRFLTA